MFDQKRADRVIRFVELLKHTKSPFNGKSFELLPWQRSVLVDVYGTLTDQGVRRYRYAYLEIPKKNGKSELCAALGLYHLFADGEVRGEVYGCAADKEQASLVFDVAVDMVGMNETLKKRTKLNLSTKQITDKKTGTVYKVMSAEAYTKHGINLSACVFDELHAQPNRELWDVMTKGAGDARRQPLWWVITTAGDDPDRKSVGWEVHEKALAVKTAREAGDAERDIRTWYPVVYSYQGEDIWSESNWAIANPSLGHTFDVEKLREAADEARKSKADERLFRWLRLNQWVTTKLSTWLPLDLWDSTIGEWSRTDMLGMDCFMGGDFSTTTDLSAICLVFPPQRGEEGKPGIDDWRVVWDCWIPQENLQERVVSDHVPYDEWAAEGWIHPTEGDQIDYTVIEERIEELRKLYKVLELDADRSFATMLLQRLEKKHLTVVDIPQQYATLTDPMQQIEILLRQKSKIVQEDERVSLLPALTHENHPVARWCFGNTSIAKNGNAQIKYVKEHKGKSVDRTKRIDLTAAWVIAMARAKFYETIKSVYETRGIRTIGGSE